VKPICFTASQLLTVVQRAAQSASSWALKRNHPVEFVWLDIACIDQRNSNPRSAAEVGRQAEIFKGANVVYAWLSTLGSADLCMSLDSLERSTDTIGSEGTDAEALKDALADASIILCRLFSDPWFSSLWTLQEAFLRDTTVILSMEGNAILLPGTRLGHQTLIIDIIGYCEPVLFRRTRTKHLSQLYDKVVQQITISGLSALASTNALAAYIATSHRKCTKDEDRIYGIQQVFGFRVGASSQSCQVNPGNYFTHVPLEIQLGEQLLARRPVLSQMHVFTQPAPLGTAWMVSLSSKVPNSLDGTVVLESPDEADAQEGEWPKCRLSVRKVAGANWGYFEGLFSPFSHIERSCLHLEGNVLLGVRLSTESYLTLSLDSSMELASCPEPQPFDHRPIFRESDQHALALLLVQSFSEGELFVLLLGMRQVSG
jgi:hypothetical protein